MVVDISSVHAVCDKVSDGMIENCAFGAVFFTAIKRFVAVCFVVEIVVGKETFVFGGTQRMYTRNFECLAVGRKSRVATYPDTAAGSGGNRDRVGTDHFDNGQISVFDEKASTVRRNRNTVDRRKAQFDLFTVGNAAFHVKIQHSAVVSSQIRIIRTLVVDGDRFRVFDAQTFGTAAFHRIAHKLRTAVVLCLVQQIMTVGRYAKIVKTVCRRKFGDLFGCLVPGFV